MKLKLLAFLVFGAVNCAQQNVVPNSSYIVYENTDPITGSNINSTYIEFYTHDGKFITKTSDFEKIQKRLDLIAPKPKPVKYAIKYWPAINIGWGTKGVPGNFIIFYDKNNNIIESFRFNKDNKISVFVYDKNAHGGSYLKDYDLNSEIIKATDFPLDVSALRPIIGNYIPKRPAK